MTPQEVIDNIINPLLALHKGSISVVKYENGVVEIAMSGACQGCARSKSTITQFIDKMMKSNIPEVKSVVDVTDHAKGTDPYYKGDETDEEKV